MQKIDKADARFYRKQQIVDLRQANFSIRSIQRMLGYKSPSPVHRLLKSEGLTEIVTKIPIDK